MSTEAGSKAMKKYTRFFRFQICQLFKKILYFNNFLDFEEFLQYIEYAIDEKIKELSRLDPGKSEQGVAHMDLDHALTTP